MTKRNNCFRYKNFYDSAMFERELCNTSPEKLDIGAIYNHHVRAYCVSWGESFNFSLANTRSTWTWRHWSANSSSTSTWLITVESGTVAGKHKLVFFSRLESYCRNEYFLRLSSNLGRGMKKDNLVIVIRRWKIQEAKMKKLTERSHFGIIQCF